MTAKIISGTETAKAIREELKKEITELQEKHNIVPGLVTILVGEDPASQSYVSAKNKTAHALGIHSEQVTLAADTSEQELLNLIEKYNNDDKINGILVQLPLPKHINEAKVLSIPSTLIRMWTASILSTSARWCWANNVIFPVHPMEFLSF